MNKLALVALVVLLACGGLWFLLGQGGGGRGGDPSAARPADVQPAEPAVATPVELTPAAAPSVEPAATQRTAAQPQTALELEHQSFDLEHARWVDVTVVLPAGVPLDDRPALLAFVSRAGEEFNDWNANRLSEALDLSDDFAGKLEKEHHWARRPLSARVRMPVPPEGDEAVLLVQSRYLHLDPQRVALPATGAVTITPELGGYVTGHCAFTAEPHAALADISVEFDGRAKEEGLMGFSKSDSRDARVRADLSFELRALSAKKKYVVQGKAKGFVGHFELSFEIDAGQHREVEILFRPGARLTGVVRGEGQPLASAQISVDVQGTGPWNDELSASTGEDGVFVLEGVPPGKVTLQASKDGWRAAEEQSFDVAERQSVEGIVFELATGERISGTVLWPDGTPVENAEVRASKLEQGWMQQLVQVNSAADGSFVLGGLESEPVELFARHAPPGAGPSAAVARVAEADAEATPEDFEWDEDSSGQWIAVASAVAPGTRELVLRLQEPLPVHGVVVDDSGAPVRSFRVSAHLAQRPQHTPEEVSQSFDTEDGAFTLGVGLGGEWVFVAEGSGDERRGEEVRLAVPQGTTALRLVLPRASAVAGVVLDPAGRPIEGAGVHVSENAQEAAFAGFGGEDTKSGAEGRFALEHVPSGSAIHATHADWAASEALALELVPGESRTDVELRLRVGARITGEVFDEHGKPQAGQNVNCAGGAMAAMAFGFGAEHSTTSDASGRFAFEHVTPGKVSVSAVPGEEELMAKFQDGGDEQSFISMLSDMRTATVEVADGAEAHVVLGAKPKQPVRVHGRVSEAGAPVGNRAVFSFAEGGALFQGMKFGRSDDSGRYELQLDRPGDYVFGVSQDEGMSSAGTQFYVEVPEVEEFEQNLALPLGRLSGVVLGPDGPAAGVALRLVASEGLMGLDDLSESRRASSGSDGAFAFQHLDPGTYSLQVGGDFDGGGSDDMRFGQAVVDGLRIEKDGALEGLVVKLAAPGKLSGVVRNAAGEPKGGVTVFVRDAAGRAISASSCSTDAAGRFTYAGIAPGRITVSARGAKLVSAESAEIEVRAGETSSVELTVNEGTFLAVSLLEDDKPVRARLRVTDEAGRRVDDLMSMESMLGLMSEGFSSRQRTVGPLAPGKYALVATTLDGKDAKKSVLVEEGQTERNVKLRLK
ncbi:MAG: carboxypeptidase regulatory-like domain-containing protein [Planctomycetes bacterium]|nr:carboxypeptidase regulatory-like domain-containing protein [Planctomycetota bacterium]